ncbi:MAG: hypothetical protein ACOC38_02655 [Promethearchaeia archaeon]
MTETNHVVIKHLLAGAFRSPVHSVSDIGFADLDRIPKYVIDALLF